jgi:hypothetical protein
VDDLFSSPVAELVPLTVAAAPSAGQGLALDESGRLPPGLAAVTADSDEILTTETPGSTGAYVDLATVGPALTVTRDGIYDIEFGALVNVTTSPGSVAVKLGSAATSDDEGVDFAPDAAGEQASLSRKIRRTLAVGDVVKLQYKAGSTSTSYSRRYLFLTFVGAA